MADISDNTNWSQLDASNNKASPNGWPEGMMPSGVNDAARGDKGALKRFWDRANPVQAIALSGGVYTFATNNPTYPASYVNGEVYTFYPGTNSAGNDQFQVAALGPKPIYKRTVTGFVPLAVYDIVNQNPAQLIYQSTLNGGAGGFILLNPFVPATGDGALGISVPGNITAGGGIQAPVINAIGASNFIGFTDRTTGAPWEWYASGGSAFLFQGSNKLQLDTATGNLTTVGNVSVSGSIGITYAAVSGGGADGAGHWFKFGWTGANLVVSVDGTAGLQLANTAQLAAYLPLSGGTISGGLTVAGAGGFIVNNAANIIGGLTAGAVNSPSITATGSGAALAFNDRGGGVSWIWYATGNIARLFTGADKLTIDTSGNVTASGGISAAGISSAGSISAGSISAGSISSVGSASIGGGLVVTGNIGVGGFIQSNIGGNVSAHYAPNAGGNAVFFAANGGMSAYGFNNLSDARLKTGIADSAIGLAEVMQLVPKSFRRMSTPDREELGLVAQDVEAVLPQAVVTIEHEDDDPRLAIDYAPVTAALINAVHELTARLATLEAKCST